MRPPPSGSAQVGLSPAIGRSLPARLSVRVSPGSQMLPRRFRICPDVEDSSLRSRDHPPRTRRRDHSHSIGEMRLQIHLAHPLKDEHAVVIHAPGPSLEGSRQNRGEPCRRFPADPPSRGSLVVTTRRLCTINTRAPFNHVEIDLQNAPLAEDEFGHWYQCELRTLAEDRAARTEK